MLCVFLEVEFKTKYCHTTLNTSECDVYVINIEKSKEKRVSDHSNHKCVTNLSTETRIHETKDFNMTQVDRELRQGRHSGRQ